MKSRRLFSMAAAVLLLCLAAGAAMADDLPQRKTCGDFEYELLPDGTAEISLYCGTNADVVIPAELDGVPVSSVGSVAWNLFYRFGDRDPGVYISVDDVNALVLDSGFVTQFGEKPDEIRAAWIEKFFPESDREAMIRFLARLDAWNQGQTVIGDFDAAGEPRDAEQYKADLAAALAAEMDRLRAEIAEKQAVADDPDTREDKARIIRLKIDQLQQELAELEARAEQSLSSEVLTDSAAIARWTGNTGITASAGDAESLLPMWRDTFTSLQDGEGVPDAFPNVMAFISLGSGLGYSVADGSLLLQLAQRFETFDAAPFGENSGYIRLDSVPRVIVVPPMVHSVEIPEGVTRIGDNAFSNLFGFTRELVRVSIPASVTYIGKDVFTYCAALTATVPAGSYTEQYCLEQGIPFVYADPRD